jgi:hypothetical protein
MAISLWPCLDGVHVALQVVLAYTPASRLGAAMIDFTSRTHGRREQMRKEYETGLTLPAVARKFGVSVAKARQAIIDAGGAIRQHSGRKGRPS